MIASMRKPAISADLQATRKRAMLMENYELGKVGLEYVSFNIPLLPELYYAGSGL